MKIPVQSIRLDGDTQSRDSVNQIIVNEYADDMREGAVFPPVVVFDDGNDIWLSEGFHRLYAARQAGQTDIEADVRKGTRRDAQRNSMQSNATHGARRTNADKRRAVEMAFRWLMEEGRSLEGITNVEVAKMAAVDEKTAARARGQIVESLDTIPEKSDEASINSVSSSAEIERLQAELADAKSKAHELDSLRKRLKDEQDERDREKRELVKALNEAQAKARQAGPEVVEKEVIREVVPDIIKERLARLEGDLRTAKSREAELERLIQDAKKHGKDIETLLSQKNDIQRSLKELAEKNDLAQEERQQALALVSAARKIREVLNEQKGVIEEASKKGVPAWANAVSIRECAERCYDIGDLLTKATNTVDIPTGTEGEYERHRVG